MEKEPEKKKPPQQTDSERESPPREIPELELRHLEKMQTPEAIEDSMSWKKKKKDE